LSRREDDVKGSLDVFPLREATSNAEIYYGKTFLGVVFVAFYSGYKDWRETSVSCRAT
jgi:hypothetical protein